MRIRPPFLCLRGSAVTAPVRFREAGNRFVAVPFCAIMTQQQASLTPLEQRIVALTAEGRSAKEIARAVSIAPRSVERHLDTCRQKLGAVNNAHLIAAAFGSGQLSA